MKFDQTVLQIDTVTANNRYYPREVVEKMLDAAKDKIDNRLILVQIDADSGVEVDLTKVIGVVTAARIDDNSLTVSIETLDVPLIKAVDFDRASFHTMIIGSVTQKDNVYMVEEAELQYIFSHFHTSQGNMTKTKTLQDGAVVQTSLIALRNEFISRSDKGEYDIPLNEVIMKINSCLFSKYPVS